MISRILVALVGIVFALVSQGQPLNAQTVVAVAGSTVTLSMGSKQGVVIGQTGKLCAAEEVSGKQYEVCAARFEVTAVRDATATAQISGGNAAMVGSGHRAVFNVPLAPPPVQPAKPPSQKTQAAASAAAPAPGPMSPLALLEAADRAFDAGRFRDAIGFYDRLLVVRPTDRYAAQRRSEAQAEIERESAAARDREEEARRAAERELTRQRDAEELAYLTGALKRAKASGSLESIRDYARQILALDPLNPDADGVRSGDRQAAAVSAKSSAEAGDVAAFDRARNVYEKEWPGDPQFNKLLAELERGFSETLGGRTVLPWVHVPAGAYIMGCASVKSACHGCVGTESECRPDEQPAHPVTISNGFYLSATETTVGQYRTFSVAKRKPMPPKPKFGQTDDHPVVNISWFEAREYCAWLGGRLPTEAEWEYAARGGLKTGRYAWGDSIRRKDADYGADVCCSGVAAEEDRWTNTSPVGSFGANGFGLHDMAGNVGEWVADWYGDYSRVAEADPKGPAAGTVRVLRGGSWTDTPVGLRLTQRNWNEPGSRYLNNGFRCARGEAP
ncbi:MAG: formylglycine-generating enzyme family protein [Thermoanaerobaculia bacterium]|nr:formylglycine-generating enzyme family protein [Thermoanaerobaculia bacterium]